MKVPSLQFNVADASHHYPLGCELSSFVCLPRAAALTTNALPHPRLDSQAHRVFVLGMFQGLNYVSSRLQALHWLNSLTNGSLKALGLNVRFCMLASV